MESSGWRRHLWFRYGINLQYWPRIICWHGIWKQKCSKKNALQQYVIKVHQTFKVVESKSQKYVVCCANRNDDIPCLFYMRAIVSKKTDTWKVTQWGGTTHVFEYKYNIRPWQTWFWFDCYMCSRYDFNYFNYSCLFIIDLVYVDN